MFVCVLYVDGDIGYLFPMQTKLTKKVKIAEEVGGSLSLCKYLFQLIQPIRKLQRKEIVVDLQFKTNWKLKIKCEIKQRKLMLSLKMIGN